MEQMDIPIFQCVVNYLCSKYVKVNPANNNSDLYYAIIVKVTECNE